MKRRYYYMAEKESENVSPMWRVLHAIIFFLTAMSSVVGWNYFDNIYDTFNYRCVLYARLTFVLRDVEYYNLSPPSGNYSEIPNDSVSSNATLLDEITPEFFKFALNLDEFDEPIVDIEKPKFGVKMRDVDDFDEKAVKVDNTRDIYVYEQELWLKNNTLLGKINIDMMKTAFSTRLTCDYVIFVDIFSLMVSSLFIVVTIYCARGGRGRAGKTPQPYRYAFIVFGFSIVMVILCAISNNFVDKGLGLFCKKCSRFTGTTYCSEYHDYFTIQQMMGYRPFSLYTDVTTYAHLATIFLWIAQLIITALRILTIADFDFYTVYIQQRRHATDGQEVYDDAEENKLRKALKEHYPAISKGDTPPEDDDDNKEMLQATNV